MTNDTNFSQLESAVWATELIEAVLSTILRDAKYIVMTDMLVNTSE